MKLSTRCTAFFLILILSSLITASDFGASDLIRGQIGFEKLRILPVTADYRNYFVLQSIEDTTTIIIGDFVGAERKIILVRDENTDNDINEVLEFYPDTKKRVRPSRPNSDLFSDIEQMKRDIISGLIFKENYSYKMQSLDSLMEKLRIGSDITKHRHGTMVRIFDPDRPNTIMSEFFFGRKDDKYDLIFMTRYYRLFHTTVVPPISYSVYCRNSTDPVIKETVERLIKMVE